MTTEPTGQGYARQSGLNDDSTEYNQHAFQIWQTLARVRTVVPVKVMAVNVNADGTGGTVDAQPLVNQMDGAGQCSPHDTIYGLPYFRLQAGGSAVVLDPVVGDIGAAGICDRDISSVKNNKGIANPGSRRKFNLADGIYFGGILNEKPTTRVTVSDGNVSVTPDDGVTSLTVTPGLIRMVAAKIQSHATTEHTVDANGTGFVINGSGLITTYSSSGASHAPTPPEVPTT